MYSINVLDFIVPFLIQVILTLIEVIAVTKLTESFNDFEERLSDSPFGPKSSLSE